MTHAQKAQELLCQADELAEDVGRNGAAVVHALAMLALAHIQFAGTFGDAING